MKYLKGQYFSFDAIVGAVIFVLALSILFNHWYGLRTQMEDKSDYLEQEAHRISELLISPGDYSTGKIWYLPGARDTKVGFGVPNTYLGNVYYNGSGTSIYNAQAYLGPAMPPVLYENTRALMATSVNYFITFNFTLVNQGDFTGLKDGTRYKTAAIGSPPVQGTEIAKVTRVVSMNNSVGSQMGYYIGTMTVYTWMPSTRS